MDDLASAACFAMEHYDAVEPLNVGTGQDLPIAELARIIAGIVDYSGEIRYDASKPDGTPRKLLDVSRMSALGWKAEIPLRQGIAETYKWYRGSATECLKTRS